MNQPLSTLTSISYNRIKIILKVDLNCRQFTVVFSIMSLSKDRSVCTCIKLTSSLAPMHCMFGCFRSLGIDLSTSICSASFLILYLIGKRKGKENDENAQKLEKGSHFEWKICTMVWRMRIWCGVFPDVDQSAWRSGKQ